MKPFLEVSHLNAWHGAAQILFDVSLHVGRGEVVALLGRNGAGKSSTLKAIMGLMPRREGELHFDGQDLALMQAFEVARLGLGYVPEDRRIFTDLTVLENLTLAKQDARYDHRQRVLSDWTLEKLFDLFPNLADMQHRQASHMSGGEQQMLSVARTLMGNPLLVMLDEPSEGIAPAIVSRMSDMVVTLKRQGVSVLLSEQNLDFAHSVCDRTYMIEKGELSELVKMMGNTHI
jgi:branched-chain amino acid transport system ATP-binding protein